MYWTLLGTICYFIIAGYVYEDAGIREMNKELGHNHFVKSLLWLPYVIFVYLIVFPACAVMDFLEK